MTKQQNYNYTADIIRAVAIIFVVFIHVSGEFVEYAPLFKTPDWWFAVIVDSSVRIGVPLFIMLSGFLLLDKNKYGEKTSVFYKKRLLRIGIPLLFWFLIPYCYNYLFILHKPLVFTDFIKDVMYLHIYYHLYYLFVIVGLYIITPVLRIYLAHIDKYSKKVFIFAASLFTLIITILHYLNPKGLNLNTAFTIFIPFISYYLLGNYLRKYIELNQKQMLKLGAIYFVFVIITAVLNTNNMTNAGWSYTANRQNINYNKYFYDPLSLNVFIMSIIAFVSLLNLPRFMIILYKPAIKKIIISIAQTSFGIYIIHPFIMDILGRYFGYSATRFTPEWLSLIIRFVIVFIFSYLVILIIRKTPRGKLFVG